MKKKTISDDFQLIRGQNVPRRLEVIAVKAALHIQRFERTGAATKIASFGSDHKRLRRELNLFLLANAKNRSRAIRLIAKAVSMIAKALSMIAKALSTAHTPIWWQCPRAQNGGHGAQPLGRQYQDTADNIGFWACSGGFSKGFSGENPS